MHVIIFISAQAEKITMTTVLKIQIYLRVEKNKFYYFRVQRIRLSDLLLKLFLSNFQIMISVLGMAGGPLLGLFLMGMFMPCVNSKVSIYVILHCKLSCNPFDTRKRSKYSAVDGASVCTPIISSVKFHRPIKSSIVLSTWFDWSAWRRCTGRFMRWSYML